jgi:nitrogen fixation NifU-like protein
VAAVKIQRDAVKSSADVVDYGYSEKVIDHFTSPRRCRIMPKPDGKGVAIAPGCGDTVWIYIAVRNEHIFDISFQACACPSAIACASMVVEMAAGRHLDEAAEILDEHAAQALGLPEDKAECSAIAASALHEAIYSYVFGSLERKAGSGAKE